MTPNERRKKKRKALEVRMRAIADQAIRERKMRGVLVEPEPKARPIREPEIIDVPGLVDAPPRKPEMPEALKLIMQMAGPFLRGGI